MGPVISALMGGNAIVVKVSEHVAWSTSYWQAIIDGALKVNGISTDLVKLVNGFGDAGEALIQYADKVTPSTIYNNKKRSLLSDPQWSENSS